MAKGQTPEQKFKHLFDLSIDELTTPGERDAARRKWREWLKRRNKTSSDIHLILAKALKDDDAANPRPPPPDPRDHGAASPGAHPFDDASRDPATMIESFARQYLTMREHGLVVFVLSIAATHVYEKFSIAPRVLFTSEDPELGKVDGARDRAVADVPGQRRVFRHRGVDPRSPRSDAGGGLGVVLGRA